MKYDEIRTAYDKSLNHIIDLQEKISEALVDDSFKTEDFKSLKDELSAETAKRDTLFEQLHVTNKKQNGEGNDDGNDDGNVSENKCAPQDVLDAFNKMSKKLDVLDAFNKMSKNLSNKVDDVYNKLSEAINNINGKSDKAETKDYDKVEHEEPKKAVTSDSVKHLFDELEKTFNE